MIFNIKYLKRILLFNYPIWKLVLLFVWIKIRPLTISFFSLVCSHLILSPPIRIPTVFVSIEEVSREQCSGEVDSVGEEQLGGGGRWIQGLGLVHRSMACVSMPYDSPELSASDRRSPETEEEEVRSGSLSSSSSSSIGKNSDEHMEDGSGSDDGEVQSVYTGGPLNNLDSLEEVLPVKKSISKFYCGKSKSFTSLSDAASCCSVQDITKPENAYTRKRKNLLAFNTFWDKNRSSISRSGNGGISKRPSNSRSMLTLAPSTNGSDSNCGETSNSYSSSPGCSLPPLPPHARRATKSGLSSSPPADNFPSWRSFSLSDLQGAAVAAPTATGLWSNNCEE